MYDTEEEELFKGVYCIRRSIKSVSTFVKWRTSNDNIGVTFYSIDWLMKTGFERAYEFKTFFTQNIYVEFFSLTIFSNKIPI